MYNESNSLDREEGVGLAMLNEVKSVHQEVYDKIKEDILCRRYLENSYLIERKIAEALYVSRTPVRQALKKLEKEGLVINVKNRGMKVTTLNEQEVKDVFEIRMALEGLVVVNSCNRIEWASLEILKRNIEKQTAAANKQDWNEFIDTDLEFHNILLHTQNNMIIKNFLRDLQGKMKLIGIRTLYGNVGRIELTLNEHKEIYNAILRNSPKEAKKQMEKHVQSVYEAACDYLASVRKNSFSDM